MNTENIVFIGGGNMARSIIGGLIADGFDPSLIRVAEPDASQRETLAASFGVHTVDDGSSIISDAGTVVLAVKPQLLKEVATSLAHAVQQSRPLVISVAAGIRSTDLDGWLGGNVTLVRSMPNTPALVQSGATGLFASNCNEEQKARAEFILRAVGLTLWLDDEAMLDAVTALSGSGPAYFFYVIEAIEKAGTNLGLDARAARLLALQTAFGAAKMALESNDEPATLRERVTSKGGTTEAALAVLKNGGLEDLFARALGAAHDRSVELADMLGEK